MPDSESDGGAAADSEAVVQRVQAVVDAELGEEEAEAIVHQVGENIAAHIEREGDAEAIVAAVGDNVTDKLTGETASEVVGDVADTVLDTIPAVRHSVLVRRGVHRVVNALDGRSDAVVQAVGDTIVRQLVEGGHAEALVEESLEDAVSTAAEEGYAEGVVRELLDEGVESLLLEDGSDAAD